MAVVGDFWPCFFFETGMGGDTKYANGLRGKKGREGGRRRRKLGPISHESGRGGEGKNRPRFNGGRRRRGWKAGEERRRKSMGGDRHVIHAPPEGAVEAVGKGGDEGGAFVNQDTGTEELTQD